MIFQHSDNNINEEEYTMAFHKVAISEIIPPDNGLKSMSCPSTIHSYSVCIEYMRKWFLSKFSKDFFGEKDKNVYIEGQHAFNDFRTKSKEELLKRNKPYVSIGCQVNLEYDREFIDMMPYGPNVFLKGHIGNEKPFFSDRIHHIALSQCFEVLETEFSFKIKVETKAQQFDLYKYCKMMFKVGATQGEYIDFDQHVPYDLMMQIAKDAGFVVSNNKVHDIIGFLQYLNNYSLCPFMYKYRNINGNDEFFVRVKDAYVHIAVPEIDFDNGNSSGHTMTDYEISFIAKVRFPTTRCYIYASESETQIQLKEKIDAPICFSTIRIVDAPMYNSNMWRRYFTTEYEDTELKSEITEIDMSSLLLEGDLGKLIRHTLRTGLDPSIFIDIKGFNVGEEYPFEMDWETMHLRSKVPLPSVRTFLVIYVSLEYYNNQLVTLENLEKRYRLSDSNKI